MDLEDMQTEPTVHHEESRGDKERHNVPEDHQGLLAPFQSNISGTSQLGLSFVKFSGTENQEISKPLASLFDDDQDSMFEVCRSQKSVSRVL